MAVYPERRSAGLSGKWIAEVTVAGDRRRKRFDTQRDAERWADFIKLTGAPPAADVVAAAPVHSFGSVVKEAKANHAGWTAGRDPSLGQRLEYVTAAFGKATPVADIRRADFDKLVAKLKALPGRKGKKLNPGTINRYLSAASAVLSYARTREYIVGTPVVPWQVEAGRRIHWLTSDQEGALSLAILCEGRKDEELTLRVLSATGMRWGEFAGLDAAQIADGWVKLDATKTDTPRDIPILPEMAADLRALVKKGVPEYYTFRKTLKRALKSAGQSEDLTVHCLRHTRATRLVHNGVDLSVVKDFLGHKSLTTTLKYTHVSPQLLQDALRKVSQHAGQSAQNASVVSKENQEETPAAEGFLEATPGIEPGYTVLQTDK